MEFTQKLIKIKKKKRLLDKLQSLLDNLYKRKRNLEAKKEVLEKSLNKEYKEYLAIENTTLVSLFHSLIGDRTQKLEKEKKEYIAVKLKYERFTAEYKYLNDKIDEVLNLIDKLSGINEEYKKILIEREEYLILNNSKESRRLLEISEEFYNLKNQMKELNEAIDAGDRVVSNLSKAERYLNSAEGYGLWDLMGGGLISNLAKHSKIDDARELLNKSQYLMDNFCKELKDVENSYNFEKQIEISTLASFADFFFDGFIMDLFIQHKINKSVTNLNNTIKNVKNITDGLKFKMGACTNELSILKKEKKKLIINS